MKARGFPDLQSEGTASLVSLNLQDRIVCWANKPIHDQFYPILPRPVQCNLSCNAALLCCVALLCILRLTRRIPKFAK